MQCTCKTAIARSEELLELAIAIGKTFNVRTRSLLRIDKPLESFDPDSNF